MSRENRKQEFQAFFLSFSFKVATNQVIIDLFTNLIKMHLSLKHSKNRGPRIKNNPFINDEMSNLPYQWPAGLFFITQLWCMLRMINIKNIHKYAELKCFLHISNQQNSDNGFIHAVSHTVYKDICAAMAEAPNQLLGGILFLSGH